jgi:predicted nucleic acid-binding Zn ribbon protein
MVKEPTSCPVCGKHLIGRSDKRFCSDQCRAMEHNQQRRANKGEQMILKINTLLRKNRTILKNLSPMGRTTTRKSYLELQGFDFNHFTHHYHTKSGTTYYFCYEYGYLLLPEDKVLIVNWQAYMAPP